jgi:hypothetical protein
VCAHSKRVVCVWGGCTRAANLQILNMQSNKLSQPLPSFSGFGQLQTIDLSQSVPTASHHTTPHHTTPHHQHHINTPHQHTTAVNGMTIPKTRVTERCSDDNFCLF